MKMPGVGHRQRLQNAADRLPRVRGENQVKVIVHQAISVQVERIALARLPHGIEKLLEARIAAKDILPVIAAIDGVVNESVIDETGSRGMPTIQAWVDCDRKEKMLFL